MNRLVAGSLRALPDPLEVHGLTAPARATVQLPGSKSITNRALVCAALADGRTCITGALDSEDTDAMAGCLRALGVSVTGSVDPRGVETGNVTLTVQGSAGHLGGAGGNAPEPGLPPGVLDARLSGTTSRFVAPLAALSGGSVLLDGAGPLRERPMADLFDALGALGGVVEPLGVPGHLPVLIDGGAAGIPGGSVTVRGDVSSQFISGLLMAGPVMAQGLSVELDGPLVSRPYVSMTIAVMRSFGADVEASDDLSRISVVPSGYRALEEYAVEPDASAASYFFALAAGGGGEVRVEGLGETSLQGDLGFVGVLAAMGAQIERGTHHTTVRGTGELHGVEVDMVDISDTVPTLAALAPMAEGPTTIGGVGFVRGKETDRISSVVTELNRLGIDAEEHDDGLVVRPGRPNGQVVRTYDDHRMAMSFAVLGLLAGGVSIADPGCVAKTFPGFWDAVARLHPSGS